MTTPSSAAVDCAKRISDEVMGYRAFDIDAAASIIQSALDNFRHAEDTAFTIYACNNHQRLVSIELRLREYVKELSKSSDYTDSVNYNAMRTEWCKEVADRIESLLEGKP